MVWFRAANDVTCNTAAGFTVSGLKFALAALNHRKPTKGRQSRTRTQDRFSAAKRSSISRGQKSLCSCCFLVSASPLVLRLRTRM